MAKVTPYQVLVRDLPTHRRFEVSPVQVAEWLKGLPMRDALGAPDDDPEAGHGVAELDLYADGAHAFAAGTFRGELTVACSRCVDPVKLVIDEKLRGTFMPRHEIPEDEDEDNAPAGDADGDEGAEVAEEDLDVFPFDGERVDLEPLLREQFVLAVPYAPLCAETCKGLCPQCGIDRNTASCSCTPPIDPRLAALKGLKIPS
ncbi:MAG TPA: DUF177 domain-containing protein [Kofleriaceae bacterium]|nr:DUF177 domain-containing protein [Kofleriaceae bacterium]